MDGRDIKNKKSSVSRFIFRSTEVENKCSDCEKGITRPALGLQEQPGSCAVQDLPFVTFDLLWHRREALT